MYMSNYEVFWEALSKEVSCALKEFIEQRKDKFPKVTTSQKGEWEEKITNYIRKQIYEADTFYDNMPESIEEV